MKVFIATFHTHADAIVSSRALTTAGIAAKMMPVPRKLSSSCGTCVRYEADEMNEDKLTDFEAVYSVEEGNKYTLELKEIEAQ